MSLFLALIAVLLVAAVAGTIAFKRGGTLRGTGGPNRRPNSLPIYHAMYVALWAALPAILLIAAWTPIQSSLIDQAVLASPEGRALPPSDIQRESILGEARDINSGKIEAGFNPESTALAPRFREAENRFATLGGAVALVVALAGAFVSFRRIGFDHRARAGVERWVMLTLMAASTVAILTTLGIVLSLLFESIRFFSMVNPVEFLFGTTWSPQMALRADQAGSSGEFGSVPLFWGTAFIGAIIAMIVAIPLGLMCAIYLTQYAASSVRAWLKPILEILAGVPTVVYGYFAALTVGPMIRDFAVLIGIDSPSSESALAAGLVMGIMIIPFVSSMADDSIAAVPQAMRDGSLALGATKSETIKRVVLPAALPGVVGGVLLAVSRAIGETMIVVMAAGLSANLTANPFQSVTTVTVQIVQLLTGDQEFDSPKTLAAFALGLLLFIITMILNLIALSVVRRYREAYE